MPTEIALLDGTKFTVRPDVPQVLDTLGSSGPENRWTHISEIAEQGERHFNPMHVAYVRELSEDTPVVDVEDV